MTTRGMRIRLGLFLFLAVVLFGALILMFGSLPEWFKRSTVYTVRFTDAPGLTPGAPVRRSGVRIGTVRDVILDEERGIVRVRIAVDAPYRLRRSEQATLVTGVLGGDTSIDFVPRQADEKEPVDRSPLEPGAELVGIRAATVGTLLKGASEVVPTTQETLNDIRKSIQRLEKLAARIEKTVPLAEDTLREYRELARDVRRTVPELQRTNTEIRELARASREAIPELQRTAEEYRLLARDVRAALPEAVKATRELQEFLRNSRDLFPSAERAIDEFRELTSDVRKAIPQVRSTVDDIGAAARTAQRLAERADVMLQENRPRVEEALKNLNTSLGQAARLLSDENIKSATRTLTNIESASQALPRMTKNADEILDQGRTTVRQMNTTLKRVEETLVDFQKVIKPLAGRGESISKNTEESVAKLNLILGDVRALMGVLDRSDGTLRRFLTDPSLYNSLDSTAGMVLRIMPRIDRILKDFEVFADKLARHPEAVGLGGVVRPGSGLKNPPTPPIPPGGGTHAPGHGQPSPSPFPPRP